MRRILPVTILVLGLLLFASSPVYAQPTSWGGTTHTVRYGETIYCIARAYQVHPNAIINANWLASPNSIYPGQQLTIPAGPHWWMPGPTCTPQPQTSCCTCAYIHTVSTGETLSQISWWYGVNMWRIAECNGISNLNYIQIGQHLCIPSP